MAIDIRKLDQETRPQLIELLRSMHEQPWSDAFLERYVSWRYFGRESWETSLLFLKGRAVAMIDAQVRTYLAPSGRLSVRETSEWFCLEAYRPIGLGIRILQPLMDQPEPILSVRGTEANQKLLPKLEWQQLPPVSCYALMLNWRRKLSELPARAMGSFRDDLRMTMTELEPSPETCAAIAQAASEHAGLVPVVLDWEPAWVRAAPPEIGRFTWLQFHLEDRPHGLALIRLYDGDDYRRGQIVTLLAADHDAASYAEMVSACVAQMGRMGAVRIRTRASAAPVKSALERAGFELEEQQPAFWWCRDEEAPSGGTHLMFLRGDDYIRPFIPG